MSRNKVGYLYIPAIANITVYNSIMAMTYDPTSLFYDNNEMSLQIPSNAFINAIS